MGLPPLTLNLFYKCYFGIGVRVIDSFRFSFIVYFNIFKWKKIFFSFSMSLLWVIVTKFILTILNTHPHFRLLNVRLITCTMTKRSVVVFYLLDIVTEPN